MLGLLVCVASLATISTSRSVDLVAQGPTLEERPRTLGKVVVFGDSYSDNGTGAWSVSNHTWPADPAYYGHRFSNGPVWIEHVARDLEMDLEDGAIGGATSNNSVVQGFTGPSSTIPVPSALDQFTAFISRKTVNPHDLFVIVIGANDAFFHGTVEGVLAAVSSMIHDLYGKGATKFLLASYPDLGNLPLRAFSTPAVSEELEKFSASLQTSLVDLRYRLCEAHIQVGFLDTYSLFKDMMRHPSVYGFDPSEITKSCLVGVYKEAPRTLCDDPDRYIFWDEYHPTRIAHKYIAAAALNATRALCVGEGLSSY